MAETKKTFFSKNKSFYGNKIPPNTGIVNPRVFYPPLQNILSKTFQIAQVLHNISKNPAKINCGTIKGFLRTVGNIRSTFKNFIKAHSLRAPDNPQKTLPKNIRVEGQESLNVFKSIGSTQKTSTKNPSTKNPSTENPNTEKTSTVKISTEKTSTEKTSTKKTSTEKCNTEKPGMKKPSMDQPSMESPV